MSFAEKSIPGYVVKRKSTIISLLKVTAVKKTVSPSLLRYSNRFITSGVTLPDILSTRFMSDRILVKSFAFAALCMSVSPSSSRKLGF